MAKTKILMMPAISSHNPVLAFMAAIGVVVSLAGTAAAQTPNIAQPQQIFQDQQTSDPFSSRGNGQAGSVMDLVHRAQQAGSLSNEDFVSEQQENLDSATAAFRAAQQKRLTGSQATPSTETGTASPKN